MDKQQMNEYLESIGGLENGFYKARIRLSDMKNQPLPMFGIQSIESAINLDALNEQSVPALSIGLGGDIGMNQLRAGLLLNLYGKNIFTINYGVIYPSGMPTPILIDRFSVGYYRMLW